MTLAFKNMSSANSLKYFLPDWDDRIDPAFDFVRDEFATGRNIDNDRYAHEVFEVPPYDGLLVSRAVVEKGGSRSAQINRRGIHEVFRVPASFPILGDCGAFSYFDKEDPPYDTGDVLDYYSRIGVNFGVSVDHLIFDTMSPNERERRKTLTLERAHEFFEGHRSKNYQFRPIGAAQGWSPNSYADSVWRLLEMGYRHIALGGLARSSGDYILTVLESVNKAIHDYKTLRSVAHVDVHLFGVAKLDFVKRFVALGVTSMDSASHLRKAWLRSGQNYWTESGTWYTAIRVPQSANHRVIHYVSKNGRHMSDVIRQELRIRRLLRGYDRGLLNEVHLDSLLDELLEYDDYLLRAGDDGQEMRNKALSREKYRRVLHDRPWKDCRCKICRDAGVEVVVFRGTNRNKRRGFHNVWVFYQRLQAVLAG